jgi:hypothetical protein
MASLSRLLAPLLFLALVAPPVIQGQEPRDLSGAWVFSVTTENGTGTPDVTLEQHGEELTGIYSSPRLGARRLLGMVRGDTVTFRIAPGEGSDVIMTFTGTVQSDGTLAGSADFGGMGGASFTARRAPARGARMGGIQAGPGGAGAPGLEAPFLPGSALREGVPPLSAQGV